MSKWLRCTIGALGLGFLLAAGIGAATASAAEPWWQLTESSAPTGLAPGGTGQIVLTATNLGDLPMTAAANPVTITDVLPAGVVATGVGFALAGTVGSAGEITCLPAAPAVAFPASAVSCTWAGPEPLEPYEVLEIPIEVQASSSVTGSGTNEISASGGQGLLCKKVGAGGKFTGPFCKLGEEAPGDFESELTGPVRPSLAKHPISFAAGPTPFGVENYTLTPENEGGTPDSQAGSHPFQLTTTLSFNQSADRTKPPGLSKDIHLNWPAGLIGNPTALPQCTEAEFSTTIQGNSNQCPTDTAVGAASVTVFIPSVIEAFPVTFVVPVFNLVPARGEPARFGFEVEKAGVTIDTAVRTGRDYGVVVAVHNTTESAAFLSSRVTVWGVPGDPRHDGTRGWSCIEGGLWNEGGQELPPCTPQQQTQPSAFISLPTSCTGPLPTSVQATSWQGGAPPAVSATEPMLALDGCNRVPFDASIVVTPDVQTASTPSGLTAKVHVPQEVTQDPTGLAASNIRATTVTLPEGVTLNSAAAGGLEACSESQVGFEGAGEDGADLFTSSLAQPFCPTASKVGTVRIKSPVLNDPLEGAVYLAAQNANPFGSLVAMYIVAEDPVSGVLVKLAGNVSLNGQTGRIVSTFENTPQVPFEDLELHFFGDSRAALATPPRCGTYSTAASFSPWSGNAPVNAVSSFDVTSGVNGGACPGAFPFTPSLTAGTTSTQAGGFAPLNTTFSRDDGNQDLRAVQLHMPAGLSGVLTGVPLCAEGQANAGTCNSQSLIGHTTVSTGLGRDPFTVTGGQVFLTGPYKGAPFGLSIVTPAKAGPFDLGTVVVRARVEVDPHTAQLTVTTDSTGPFAIPQILDGIPLEIKRVSVSIDRSGFTFNSTNCSPMAITGTLTSTEGAAAARSVPFQVTNCATLKFAPRFTAATSGRTSKASGASLTTTLNYPAAAFGTQANITQAKVELPKQLPSRLTTLQKACVSAVFEANPAKCPEASVVGHATAKTPILPVPLTGPAYLVSHGGEAFPALTVVLQGYGITIDLVGTTAIKNGITSTTFKTVPDAPVSSFELSLPEGPHSALAANGKLCTAKLAMPTSFVAQNGAVLKQSTPIAVTGCANVLTILSHSVKGRSVALSIGVPSAGKLTASGKRLRKSSKSSKGRETLQLTLKTPARRRFATKVKLTFVPSHGGRLSKTLPVKFKR